MTKPRLKAMCVHAHFDDYEFVVAGTFQRWRAELGARFRGRVVVCTDGAAGHHLMTRASTARRRLAEQRASAKIGGEELSVLRLPGGRVPREGCLSVDRWFLAALWREIREFEPDVLFCPPLPADVLAGVHVDHWAVAEAVRKVAYMINVPHAFSPEFPDLARATGPARSVKTPVIFTVYDGYMEGANAVDLAVPMGPAFETVSSMAWCHQSQIREWLPWVGRHNLEAPATLEDWNRVFRARCLGRNRALGLKSNEPHEFFTLTAWGEVPDSLAAVGFPSGWVASPAQQRRLSERIRRWRGV